MRRGNKFLFCVLVVGLLRLERTNQPNASVRLNTQTNSYLADEHKDKKKADLDLSGWELVHSDPGVTPQQGNGSDCGCFASAFAYLISEGIDFKHVRYVNF